MAQEIDFAVNWNEPEWRFPEVPELAERGMYSPEHWEDSDMADWFTDEDAAFAAAKAKFEDEAITVVRITTWIQGEAEIICQMVREGDTIKYYEDSEQLLMG